MEDDGWLRREGARWRDARESCPHPDVLAMRQSELFEPLMRDQLAAHIGMCEACSRLAADLDPVLAAESIEPIEGRILARVRQEAAPTQRWRFAAAAAVLLACAAGAVWWMRSPSNGGEGSSAMNGAATAPPQLSQSAPTEPLEVAASWTIEAPPVRIPMSSLGVSRSGNASSAASLVEALAPYQEGRYGDSIPLLEAVARLDPESADAAFYLGVARLLANHPADALPPLERAAALAPPDRHAEIAWYRATAEQRCGKVDAARTRLDARCAAASDYRARACAAGQALR